MVVAAGFRIAGNLGGFAGNAVRIAGAVIFALAEALAAGLIRHLRIFSTHMNVVLAAGIILIVGTVYNRISLILSWFSLLLMITTLVWEKPFKNIHAKKVEHMYCIPPFPYFFI